jgi:hypothetical protein
MADELDDDQLIGERHEDIVGEKDEEFEEADDENESEDEEDEDDLEA